MPDNLLTRYGYQKVPGDQPESIIDLNGPKSYIGVSIGTPPSGGQTVRAQDFGLGSLDYVTSMGSTDGRYEVTVFPLLSPPTTQLPDGAFTTAILMWKLASGGTQVGAGIDLSGASVRLFARGR